MANLMELLEGFIGIGEGSEDLSTSYKDRDDQSVLIKRILDSNIDQDLFDAWEDHIVACVEGENGWTITTKDGAYAASTKFEALLLMLCDFAKFRSGD